MKTRIGRASILLVVSGLWLGGQTAINGGRVISGNWDAGNAASTRPAKTGAGLPANCNVGEQFFRTDAAAGQNLYFCTAANTWTQMEAGGGGAPSGPAAGDLSESYPNPAVAKINGTSVPTNSAADQTLVTTASATSSWVALANCVSNGGVLQYATATHTFSCHSLTAADMPASVVQGAASLTTPGAIPKVSPAGTLAESAITDNGTTALTVTGRVLQIGTALPTLLAAAVNSVWSANSQSVTPQMFGGKADARTIANDGVIMLANPQVLGCTWCGWTSVDVGKPITILGAGSAGGPLNTTISGVLSSANAIIADPALTEVNPSLGLTYGTDNAAAFTAALAASDHVEIPEGKYLYTPPISLGAFKRLRGVGGSGYNDSGWSPGLHGSVLVVKGGSTANAIENPYPGGGHDYAITVEGVTIDCGKQRSPSGGMGLYFSSVFMAKVSDTAALGCHGNGFEFSGGTTLTIDNINANGGDGAGVVFIDGYQYRVRGVTAETSASGQTCIQVIGGTAHTLDGLYAEGCSYGISFSGGGISLSTRNLYTSTTTGGGVSVTIGATTRSSFDGVYGDGPISMLDTATTNSFQNVRSGTSISWGAGLNAILNNGTVSAGAMTVYDATATTGVSSLDIRAGAGQSGHALQRWLAVNGTSVLASVNELGGFSAFGYASAPTDIFALSSYVPHGTTALHLGNDRGIAWSADGTWYGTLDLGLARGSAGLLEVNTGTAGALAKLNTAPGGTVPAWAKYSLIAIANGVNGCANANGCWQVNGVLGANKAAGLTQDVVLFALPAKGKVTDWRIKTATACTGPATAKTGLGTTGSDVLFRAQTYDIKAAVGNTNLTEGPTAGAGSGTAAATNIVASLITTTQNVDQLVAGCAVDYWVQWAVLP